MTLSSLYTPTLSLVDLLEQALKKHHSKIALRCQNAQMSYGELNVYASHLAWYFSKHLGLQKGDRIALFMPNTMQFIITSIAALKIGAIIVNINPLYTPREVENVLKDASPKALVFLKHFHKTLSEIDEKLWPKHLIMNQIGDTYPFFKKHLMHFWIEYIQRQIPPIEKNLFRKIEHWSTIFSGTMQHFTPIEISGEDIAFLQYTGGTTGAPKGAILSQNNMAANVIQAIDFILKYYPNASDFRIATALPLYHIFSLTANFLTFFILGAENLLIVNPRNFSDFIGQWKKYPIDAICGVNTLFSSLLKQEAFHSLDKTRLKLVLGGGMAVSETVAQQWQERTQVVIIQAYGLTEASPAVCINPMDLKGFQKSIGYPVNMTEIKIASPTGEALGIGERGELWVKGPQVMKGYWNKPDETKEVLDQEGWLHTGDIGYQDEEGFIYLVDRKKEMIIVSGFNVYPSEVEEALRKHPLIDDVAVLGHKDSEDNEEVIAFYTLKNENAEPTIQQLHDFSLELLTRYKIPKKYVKVESLPKSPVGKILKKDLKVLLETLYE